MSTRIEDIGVGDEIEDVGVRACCWRGSRRDQDRDIGRRYVGDGENVGLKCVKERMCRR